MDILVSTTGEFKDAKGDQRWDIEKTMTPDGKRTVLICRHVSYIKNGVTTLWQVDFKLWKAL